MDLSEKFESGRASHSYQRIGPDYKVNIYVGANDEGKMSMVIAENGRAEKVKSSRLIDVNLARREDQKLSLSFDLLDDTYAPMFMIFCEDMIVVCESSGKNMAISSALMRWKYWKEMFGRKRSELLEKQEIKGLIGELFVLRYRMAPEYGITEAVKSWMGPLLGHKDFEINDTWYEVKTIASGSASFTVNSLEQLESDVCGHLLTVVADDASETSGKAVNLNQMVRSVADLIKDPETMNEFLDKIDQAGYLPNTEYDSINFSILGLESYLVDDSFPRLRRSEVNQAIGNAKYTILLAGIARSKE